MEIVIESINRIIQQIHSSDLTEDEQKTLAVRVSYAILNAVDFELIVEEDGSLSVFTQDGEIKLSSEGPLYQTNDYWNQTD